MAFRMRSAETLLALAVAVAACGGGSSSSSSPGPSGAASSTAAPVPVATTANPAENGYAATRAFPKVNFAQMTGLFVIPGDDRFALVLTKDGTIRRVNLAGDDADPTVFLDLRPRLITNPASEEGLLGLAFAPDFSASRRFYLYYSAGDPRRVVISRFIAAAESADIASEQVILEIQQPYPNHNGGALAFGPDGDLYIGVGDGGSEYDPMGYGQNNDTLLAKILRIDVSGDAYSIPPDNPFANRGGRPEIFATGMRNPWRIAFDEETGVLWVADVGQDKREEVDRVVNGGNYGWSITEGDLCHKPPSGCNRDGLIAPRAVYGHNEGCSITGGYVYRGKAMPELDGWYVYGDYCSGRVWAVNTGDDSSAPVALLDSDSRIASFGQDAAGEIYLVTFSNAMFRLARKA